MKFFFEKNEKCLELPDLARKLIRHVRRKISADVDGGLSGVSRGADTGARTPIGVSGNFVYCSDKENLQLCSQEIQELAKGLSHFNAMSKETGFHSRW